MDDPQVTRIQTPDPRTIVITFEREMLDNADLVDPYAYLLNGGVCVLSVERLGRTQVKLTTNQDLKTLRHYLLTVLANPGT
jgi:hypothetical protein